MRKATGSYRTYSSLVKLQPWFLSLRWKTCLRQNCNLRTWVCNGRPAFGQNCNLGSCACSEGPAVGQSTLIIYFYFRGTLGVKEVLQSSKNSSSIFLWFLILHRSHSLKMCFRKMCLFVGVCPSPTVEPKPISFKYSISRVLLYISRAVFFLVWKIFRE